MAANAERSSPRFSEEQDEPDAEIVDGDSGEIFDIFGTSKPLETRTEPFESPSDVFSVANAGIPSELPVDISNESSPDISTEPPAVIPSEPPADASSKPLANILSEPPVDIFSEPLADISSEPLADISSQPLADISSQPLSDILSEPPVDIFGEPLADISSQPLADISSQPLSDILSEPPVDIFGEPLADASSESLADASSESLADASSESLADTSSESLADISSEPFADIFSEPLADTSSEPVADISSDSPVDISSAPLLDISNEPPADISSEPLAAISSEPVADTPSEPVADILGEPVADILGESPVDISSQLLADTPSELVADVLSESPVDISSAPLLDISSETLDDISNKPLADISTELPEDIHSEPPVDASSEQHVEICCAPPASSPSEPPVDISSEPIPDIFTEPPGDISNKQPDENSNEILADITSEPPVNISIESLDDDPLVGVSSEPPGEISNDQLADAFSELEVDLSSKVLSDIASEAPTDITCEPLADVSGEPLADISSAPSPGVFTDPLADISGVSPPGVFTDPLADISGEPLADISSASPPGVLTDPLADISGEPLADISSASPPCVFTDPLADITAEIPSQPQPPAVTSSDSSEPLADIFSEEGVATNSIVSKALSMQTEEEVQDIFTEATVELSLDSAHDVQKMEVSNVPTLFDPSSDTPATADSPQEEEESTDAFEVNITVTNPEKVGDGMNAYMAYKVSTQTTLAVFCSHAFTVSRRFSDFLALYEKLTEKHSQNGYLVPPPPEKSILGMTKLKVGKEDSSSAEFVERRRAALERYLLRVVSHPSLIQDPDVLEFLEKEEFPRPVRNTLTGAGIWKMISRATEAISRMTMKMEESDAWFEQKMQHVESEDLRLRKLHAIVGSMVTHRKEMSGSTAQFAKSVAVLGSSEDNTALSCVLTQLAELEAQVEQLQQDQAISDYSILAELLTDNIRLLGALRNCFDQRIQVWQHWQNAQNTLQKQREVEAKLQWANKPDKLQLAKDEIAEWESKVSQYEREFEKISATVRNEVLWFEKEKARDFKTQILRYLESLLHSEQQVMKHWETFLPEAKAIA
ncbi:uncharacterized protein LOC133130493 [Conger conger]|uniref:uncharacterized protein LOC133130493 n=1 Tax=Conger conger TaxID=82655 RepID=UPI002A5AD32C|nr:uncharacterized protein LOC133130493 [Conger conger]